MTASIALSRCMVVRCHTPTAMSAAAGSITPSMNTNMRGRSDQRRTLNLNIRARFRRDARALFGERRLLSIGLKNTPRKFGDMSQQSNKLQKVVNYRIIQKKGA